MREGTGGSGWARHLDRVPWLGPGMVMAATAIGASHLVLAPTAGARYGYALLWIVPLSHLFKYPAFEFGPRYAVARGESLLAGYARVPGPRGWALGVFLLGTIVQGVTVLAGVLGVAAAVAAAVLPALPVPAWSAILGIAVALLLRTGGFDGLSALSKWMLLALALMTAVAFVATPPPASAWARMLVPSTPESSLFLLAALLGWLPTGIDVSVWHSMWALERQRVWAERADADGAESGPPRPRETPPGDAAPGGAGVLRLALADLRLGYALSFVLAVMFLGLGAEVLRPAGLVPEGAEVAVTLARLYTDVLGGWALPLFLLAAFAGMFSTTYGVMDGFPRAFSRTVVRLWPGRDPPASRLYRGFLWTALALALAEILFFPDPVLLVMIAAVASFLLAPVTFGLNYWCMTRLTERPDRPGPLLRAWSVAGILCSAGAAGLFLWILARG